MCSNEFLLPRDYWKSSSARRQQKRRGDRPSRNHFPHDFCKAYFSVIILRENKQLGLLTKRFNRLWGGKKRERRNWGKQCPFWCQSHNTEPGEVKPRAPLCYERRYRHNTQQWRVLQLLPWFEAYCPKHSKTWNCSSKCIDGPHPHLGK